MSASRCWARARSTRTSRAAPATARTTWAGRRPAPMRKRYWPERLATTGLDPNKVGERVVDAIRTKTFYAFVSTVPAEIIKARHRRIEEALNSPWVTHY